LRRDGIWLLDKKANAKSPSNRQLLADEVAGGFTPEVYQLLKNDPRLVQEIAHIILDSHFPETIHQDILDEVWTGFHHIYKKEKRS
jgi:putative restriction endonuclease